MLLHRIIDWLVGRREPTDKRIRDYERRLEILTARLQVRRRPR